MITDRRVPSTASTTELALRYLDAAWNRFDVETIDQLADPKLRVFYPLMPAATTDRQSFTQVLHMIRTGLPDVQLVLRHVATSGGTAVFAWDAAATHTGELFGIAPSGSSVRWTGLSVVEISDGRVVSEYGEEDALGLLRQLGAVPS
jgi:predicted ester cyclase